MLCLKDPHRIVQVSAQHDSARERLEHLGQLARMPFIRVEKEYSAHNHPLSGRSPVRHVYAAFPMSDVAARRPVRNSAVKKSRDQSGIAYARSDLRLTRKPA